MHIFIHFLTLCLQNGITEHIYVIQDALNKMSMSTDWMSVFIWACEWLLLSLAAAHDAAYPADVVIE